MRKGIVQIIPIVAIALVLGISSVGIVGSVRSKSIITSSVLSENTGKNGKGEDKKSEGPGENHGKSAQSQSLGSSSEKQNQSDKKDIKSSPKANTDGDKKNEQKNAKKELTKEVGEASGGAESSPSSTPGRKIRTNFPITVNPVTNEKTVTTPGGVKTIILPEVAIQNMIKAGFPVVLPPDDGDEGTPSATPGEGTPSGSTESAGLVVDNDSEISLTEEDGKLVWEIPAVKQEQFLGVVDVKIKVKGIVSAEDGTILKLKKSFFDSLLDLLSI